MHKDEGKIIQEDIGMQEDRHMQESWYMQGSRCMQEHRRDMQEYTGERAEDANPNTGRY